MFSVDGYDTQKERQDESKIQKKKLKLWRLRESEVKEDFTEAVTNNFDGNEDWCVLKRKLLDVASEVCGYANGKHRHSETFW